MKRAVIRCICISSVPNSRTKIPKVWNNGAKPGGGSNVRALKISWEDGSTIIINDIYRAAAALITALCWILIIVGFKNSQ